MSVLRAIFVGFLGIAMGGALPSLSRAQGPGDTTAAIVAAVKRIRGDYASGRTKISVPDGVRLIASERAVLARAIGADTGTLNTSRRCDGSGPGGCHLIDAAVFVEVVGHSQSRNQSDVRLRVYEETSSTRQPIHGAEVVVTLVRRGAQWDVSSVRPIWES